MRELEAVESDFVQSQLASRLAAPPCESGSRQKSPPSVSLTHHCKCLHKEAGLRNIRVLLANTISNNMN